MSEQNLQNKEASARLTQAKQAFEQAVSYIKRQQYSPAEPLLKKVLKIMPQHANSYQLLSIIASQRNDFAQALKYINHAISNGKQAEYYYNRAIIYQKLNKFKNAQADLQRTVRLNDAYYPAFHALGDLFFVKKEYDLAIMYYEKTLKWVNTNEVLWNNLGLAYMAQDKLPEAIKCFEIKLRLSPNHERTLATLGNLYNSLKKHAKAIEFYEKLLQLNPNFHESIAPLLSCKNMICDWDKRDELLTNLKNIIAQHSALPYKLRLAAFEALWLPLTNQEQLNIANYQSKIILDAIAQSNYSVKFKHTPASKQRLRIAYISSSFRNFPTGHLTQDLYGCHNREHFEVYIYSYCKDDGSSYYKKISQSCDHFIDITDLSIESACQKIYEDKIDILIDLMGNSENTRLDINALRPAPINVRYLGAPGTTGVKFFDYLISDATITPQQAQPYYTENLVLMPHTYQVNPLSQDIAKLTSRTECGLPATGIVFCAFNNSYKIEPMIFNAWMKILTAVPGSVLWLQGNELVQQNLQKEAEKQGVAAQRLIFAARKSKDEHLARQAHADLYLDTHYYNAHTTASDALTMNVPVITFPGETFQSRVAASLLKAIGLEDLIMPSIESYIEKAIALATDAPLLAELKQRLISNKKTYPLFDTHRFTKNLENAYQKMWDHYLQNKKELIVVAE